MNYRDMYSFVYRTNGEILNRLMKEPFMTEMCSMEVERNNKFYGILNRKVQQFIDGGIIDHNMVEFEKWYDPKYYQRPLLYTKEYLENGHRHFNPHAPKVLTMDQLEAGFVICLIPLMVSVIIFVGEWFWKLTKGFVLSYLLMTFLNQQQNILERQNDERNLKLDKKKTLKKSEIIQVKPVAAKEEVKIDSDNQKKRKIKSAKVVENFSDDSGADIPMPV
jgi:hypothetical protein